jgi:rod shape-determining protein MreC
MHRKNFLLLASLVIISFALMTYQSKRGPFVTDFLLKDLMNISHELTEKTIEAVKRPFRIMTIRDEENRELRILIDELFLERGKYREALLENRRLREILRLIETSDGSIASAAVISRRTDRWANTVTINKGNNEGVLKDMIAVTPHGLAGKVLHASGSYSDLLLVTDINFSVSVRLQESRLEGILSGNGTRTCILKYIPQDAEVKAGDIIITSGLDLLFPKGIPVGYVSTVSEPGAGGSFKYIEVIPFQDDTRMEEVLIIK